MNEADLSRSESADNASASARREPTLGLAQALARAGPPATEVSVKRPDPANRRLLEGYGVRLAENETLVDDAEVVDSNGANYLVLTDRRFIIKGRYHEAVYPLRMISRLTVLKYTRWWMLLLGVALGAFGALGALMPVALPDIWPVHYLIPFLVLVAAGIATAVVALVRPILYVEIKCMGADQSLFIKKDFDDLLDFLSSLGQRIG